MNRKLLALAVLGTLSGAVAAQSSVTVYGVLDTYYTHDSGGNPAGAVSAIDGGFASLNGTRLGFKGREDLGNGLAALFTAEMGFGGDTGALDASGNGFGRQAFVGLQGSAGVVKLGRQYNPLFNGGVKYDPFLNGLEGAYSRVISLGAGKRLSNALVYATPANLGGFNAEAAFGFGEVPGSNAQGRVLALSVGYAAGPFSTSLIHNSANNVPLAGASMVTTRNTGLGASYRLGWGTLSALYQFNRNDAKLGALDNHDLLLGAALPFGASTVMVSYVRHKNHVVAHADTHQGALGYSYALSKRTTLYASYARIANQGAASIATPGTPGGVDKQFNTGINHAF
ncbi:porin [Duganella sp. Dugasp56]|uniref:porin n=1 Tax=Duganella sp. Dugasp56 TaxID=3243046 RepID=UPI0039AF7002